jgi:predicted GIY-YIG superfamily endonuclease
MITLTFLYRLYDGDGTLLYIGITRDPNGRFAAHAADKPWWDQVVRHSLEEVAAPTASIVERDAIRAEHPRYNVAHRRRTDDAG